MDHPFSMNRLFMNEINLFKKAGPLFKRSRLKKLD